MRKTSRIVDNLFGQLQTLDVGFSAGDVAAFSQFCLIDLMSGNPTSRKHLRVLAGATKKLGSIWKRRKRNKDEYSNGDDDSNTEDDQPILSRIASPTQSSNVSNSRQEAGNTESTETVVGQNSREASINKVEEYRWNQLITSIDDDEKNDTSRKTVKSQRRRGMVSVEELASTFATRHVLSHNRPIAKQPVKADDSNDFSFRSDNHSFACTSSTSNNQFSSHITQANLTSSQLQQAAQDAFLGHGLGQGDVPKDSSNSKENSMTIQQFLSSEEQNNRNTHNVSFSNRANAHSNTPHNESYQTQRRGPLDHLRLNSEQSIPPLPGIDKVLPVAEVSEFVHSQVLLPVPSTDVYRNGSHKLETPPHIFECAIPDATESLRFVKDAENDGKCSQPPRNRKIIAPGSQASERVPVSEKVNPIDHDSGFILTEGNYLRTPDTFNMRFHSADAARQKSLRPQHQIARSHRIGDRSDIPENFYTAPVRLSTAYATAARNLSLKRKRPTDPALLPPPSYIHQHTGNPAFNVFSNGILLYPELCLLLAAQLPVQTLINLYSISKDFHVIIDQRLLTIILNQATLKAPNAVRCYPWRCFNSLSQPDPSLRAQTSLPAERQAAGLDRDRSLPQRPHPRRVPTFRWLRFAIHREKVIHALYQVFAARGVPLPGAPHQTHAGSFCLTLHKIWFIFDIPDNPRRINFAHNPKLMTDADLANTLVFVTKLDMLCNSSLAAEKRDALRKLMLSSVDGFDTILKVLRRDVWEDELQLLRAWTRYGLLLDHESTRGAQRPGFVPFRLSAEQLARSKTIFGIPKDEAGLLKREFWGKIEFDPATERRRFPSERVGVFQQLGQPPRYLIRPDQLALRETVRRGMVFSKQFLRGLLHGYVDEETLQAVPPRDLNSGRSVVLEKEGEYDFDDAVAGVRALSLEEGGDELLDLGDTTQGSEWTVRHQPVSLAEVQRRSGENELLGTYMAQWREEVVAERRGREYTGFRVVE